MAAAMWQIQVGNQLSKQYSIEKLAAKFEKGVITNETLCTEDNGASFVAVSAILKIRKPRFQKVRQQKRQQSSAIQTEVSDSPAQPAARELVTSVASNELLADLYANAANSNEAKTDTDDDHAALEEFTLPDVSTNLKFTLPNDPGFYEPSAVAQAAAMALAETQKRDESPCDSPRGRATAKPDPASRPPATTELSEDFKPQRNWKSTTMSAMMAVVGVISTAVLIHWFGSPQGPPTYEDLTGGAIELSDFDSKEAVTVESLHARTQILGIQVGRITRALLKQEDAEVTDVVLPELHSNPVLPLFPFQQRSLSESELKRISESRDRYSMLVQEKGPNGRELDEATIKAYVTYLKTVVNAVDSHETDRAAALHELSEWVKLIYLLELGRLESDDPNRRQTAAAELLTISNDGLAQLYPELKSGDMRFVDVFDRSEPAEQSRLVLVRYWYYRAVDRKSADIWLKELLKIIDESQHGAVRASISEVDSIERT